MYTAYVHINGGGHCEWVGEPRKDCGRLGFIRTRRLQWKIRLLLRYLWKCKGMTYLDKSEEVYMLRTGTQGMARFWNCEFICWTQVLKSPDFIRTMGCCDRRWGGHPCSWPFFTTYWYGYRKGDRWELWGREQQVFSTYLEGGPRHHMCQCVSYT